MNSIRIRTAVPDDAEEILEIYAYYVTNTAITFEYEVPSLKEFRTRMERTFEKYPYFVAEENNRIIGYAYAGPFVGRAAYDWSAEMSIYVEHEKRKNGVGRSLYEALEESLRSMGILNLYACIGYPRGEKDDEYLTRNSARFHEHLGYHLIGRFHQCGYKFGRWYDMIWMEKMIGEHQEYQPAVRSFRKIIES